MFHYVKKKKLTNSPLIIPLNILFKNTIPLLIKKKLPSPLKHPPLKKN